MMTTTSRQVLAVALLAWTSLAVRASTASLTGTLASSTDVFETTFTLPAASTVTLQTYGFGGGTNAAGMVIPAGGTFPFLALFAGTGFGATIVTDALSNPFGTSADLLNYNSFIGCPPAGQVQIGGQEFCGDVTMTDTLAAGTYTVTLSDGLYQANAVVGQGGSTLGDGFADFTAGQFCNAMINGVNCPNTSGAWALDISGLAAAPVPEPGGMALLVLMVLGVVAVMWRARAARSIGGI